MSGEDRLAIIVVSTLVGYVVVARLVLWRFLQPLARRLLSALALLIAAWVVLHMLSDGERTFFGWFFDPSSEFASGAMLSSTLLLSLTLMAFLNGLLHTSPTLWRRAYWWFMAGVFLFLGLDEYYSFHESVDSWRTLYGLCGASIVTLSFVMYVFERDIKVLLFLVGGLGIIGFAGIALDAFANEALLSVGDFTLDWFICRNTFYGINCQSLGILEEFLELAGASVILAGFVSYAEYTQTAHSWQWSRRALAGGALLWGVWMIGTFWVVPTVEAELLANDSKAEYLDGALSLESYRLSHDVAYPGDQLDVTLFFRANKPLSENYYLSVHLLSHPDVNSVSQYDLQLGEWDYPSSAWIPGPAVKNTAHLNIPEDLPAPASYWVMVRVWVGPDLEAKTNLPVSDETLVADTDLWRIAPDTLILYSLPVLSRAEVPDPPTATRYKFSDGFTLYGYFLPETSTPGESLTLKFWWQADQDVARPLTHFIHLVDSTSGDFFVFDQLPFGGRLPSDDWPKGLKAVDQWTFELPGDIPVGEYVVYMGMYETSTVIRVPVTDENGAPVQDDVINLGAITLER